MTERHNIDKRRKSEAGAALLIAIFALLLISVIAIALVVTSGTDTALKDNYRTSTGAYYAAVAGLEEARGRLLSKNPDTINIAAPGYFPDATNPAVSLSDVLYILNPAGGETVNPDDLGNNLTYPDKEYETEFGVPVTGATIRKINSVSGSGGVPGPLYKWVRITGTTVRSLGTDVAGDGNTSDGVNPLFYEPVARGGAKPGLMKGFPTSPPTPLNSTERQALSITALAVFPPNTQKLLQYVVAPVDYGLSFHGALVVPGSTVVSPTIAFHRAENGTFAINGLDANGMVPPVAGCSGGGNLAAIGVTDYIMGSANRDAVRSNILTAPPAGGYGANYLGTSASPSVDDAFINSSMSTAANLNSMVQKISKYAGAHVNGPATETDLPLAMSAANPMTVVVNGNLTINSDFTGYGLLVVTGDLTSNADFGWKGVVLVVGSGNVVLGGGLGGTSEFDGAFLVAHTMDTSTVPPTPLPALGLVNFDATNAKGRGIYYNSCWVKMALTPPTFEVLSFREIVSPN